MENVSIDFLPREQPTIVTNAVNLQHALEGSQSQTASFMEREASPLFSRINFPSHSDESKHF